MPRSVNVLVTDDHTLFRKGIQLLLKTFPLVAEVYEAANGEEALRKMGETHIDVILLDLDMPVLNGWDTARRIVKKYPGCYIIVVSMNDDLKIISELIEIGVHSYLLKNAEPAEVQLAITGVLENQFYYNQIVSKALRSKVTQEKVRKETDSISAREAEIIELICQELTMKEIGERLYLSEQTIMTHRKNIMKKLQAKNTVSIVRYALQSGIIQL
jgi:DNA-binding NarL/FixJ family response regulator